MRRTAVIVLALLICAAAVAFAALGFSGDQGSNLEVPASVEGTSFQSQLEQTVSADPSDAQEEAVTVEELPSAADVETAADGGMSGEDFSYTNPDQRYVTETQRHQNFFKAVGEGRVRRLQVISANVRPVGDPNTSYIKFIVTGTDGSSSSGIMVMKYDAGMWRIAAFSQLSGDLQGGTNYQVPSSFEDVLAREIAELQPFLTKIAEGRFSYMEAYSVSHPSENETVLTGVVAGTSGVTVPAEMRLRRDYGIWHLTYITNPP